MQKNIIWSKIIYRRYILYYLIDNTKRCKCFDSIWIAEQDDITFINSTNNDKREKYNKHSA